MSKTKPRSDKALLPCKSCPWRVENDASVIPHYNQDKAEALACTVGPDDAFRNIMACHHSTEDAPLSCKGYLAMEGWSNLNVRLRLMSGIEPNPDAIVGACRRHGVELEPDFESVLYKLSCDS